MISKSENLVVVKQPSFLFLLVSYIFCNIIKFKSI
nr:MAG TPA: hypothetical protein [Caudoviricetes sp.]